LKLVIHVISILFTLSASGYEPATNEPKFSHQPIEALKDLKVEENLGQTLTLDRQFTNEAGALVPLKTYFDGKRPVLLSMVYYGCPSLCSYHLNGLLDTLKNIKQPVGSDFQIVVVSMDHTENHELAAQKKANYIKALGQVGAENSFHFLVGSEENVKGLAKELGFPFQWNEAEKQFAHPAVLHVVTPNGVISRYLHGILFDAPTLRLSLVEAAKGEIGSVIEQIILFCYQFNPHQNKYTFYAYNIMRVGAGMTVIILAAFLIPVWLRERRRSQSNNFDTIKGEA
jgi:protein SCO1/2